MLTHVKGHFLMKDLRKFCEQASDNLELDETYQRFILAHNVSSIDWLYYKQFLPEDVYRKYYCRFWRLKGRYS